MPYADTDFWLALIKDDDWLATPAERLLEEHEGDLRVSCATFIELFLIEERFAFDRELAASAIMELAESDVSEEVVFAASEYADWGANTFDAFHAAFSEGEIISSDDIFDELALDRIALAPE